MPRKRPSSRVPSCRPTLAGPRETHWTSGSDSQAAVAALLRSCPSCGRLWHPQSLPQLCGPLLSHLFKYRPRSGFSREKYFLKKKKERKKKKMTGKGFSQSLSGRSPALHFLSSSEEMEQDIQFKESPTRRVKPFLPVFGLLSSTGNSSDLSLDMLEGSKSCWTDVRRGHRSTLLSPVSAVWSPQEGLCRFPSLPLLSVTS